VSEKRIVSTRTHLLLFPSTLNSCRWYRHWVGSTEMASLASFSQGLGSSDPGSELPIWLHCWVFAAPIRSSDPVSEMPINPMFAQ
jgi:hypothetical protein